MFWHGGFHCFADMSSHYSGMVFFIALKKKKAFTSFIVVLILRPWPTYLPADFALKTKHPFDYDHLALERRRRRRILLRFLWFSFLCFDLSTYLPTYLPTNLPTYLPTYQSTYLSTYLPTYQSTYLPTYQSTYLPTYLPTCGLRLQNQTPVWLRPLKRRRKRSFLRLIVVLIPAPC